MQGLYLIECQNYMKIGVAYDVQRRLIELSTGNPFELHVIAVYGYDNAQAVEAALHQRFSPLRVRGEWFCLSEEDVKAFHALCVGLGGTAIPVVPTVEELDIENAENEIDVAEIEKLNTQEKEQDQKRERESRIIELHQQGRSQVQIEGEVFGYTGGGAAYKVSTAIKKFKAGME